MLTLGNCPGWICSLSPLLLTASGTVKTHWRMTKNCSSNSLLVPQPVDVAANLHRGKWNVVHVNAARCFWITRLADNCPLDTPQPAQSHHLSLTLKPKSIQLGQQWQLAADAGGHTPLHSHNGLWHNWGGARNQQHSRSFQEAGLSVGYQQCRLSLFICAV